MRPDDADLSYLLDMRRYAAGLVSAVQGKTFEEYLADETLRLATERRIEIIGEAARKVSDAFKSAHSEVPWRKITAQRHILAHEYGDIDDDLIWRVATVHVPELLRLLEPLMPAGDPPK